MKKLILSLFLITSCSPSTLRHFAINNTLIVSEVFHDYVKVYSSSTQEATTSSHFLIHYPYPIHKGDTLRIGLCSSHP
ncbi:hypothetical protein [Mongoliibacter ruber]|uniref:hypothetical protein n=1 Tax=Mongoliibacter ruber TaxID=1750599 RepID=UPI0011B22473|nr:hypothetical protein [Mongoliibacter ruber]